MVFSVKHTPSGYFLYRILMTWAISSKDSTVPIENARGSVLCWNLLIKLKSVVEDHGDNMPMSTVA